MQKVQVLLQPTWMVTQAECSSSRLTGRDDGIACSSSTTSVMGPQLSAWSMRSRTRSRLWVPMTTSTQGAFSLIKSRSFWAAHPPTTSSIPGLMSLIAFSCPRLPYIRLSAFSRIVHVFT
jgi:hypothetical protein